MAVSRLFNVGDMIVRVGVPIAGRIELGECAIVTGTRMVSLCGQEVTLHGKDHSWWFNSDRFAFATASFKEKLLGTKHSGTKPKRDLSSFKKYLESGAVK